MISNSIPAAQTCLKCNSHSVKLSTGPATHGTLRLSVFMWHRWIAGNESFYSASVSEFIVQQSLPHLTHSSQIITKGSVWCVRRESINPYIRGYQLVENPQSIFVHSIHIVAEIKNVYEKLAEVLQRLQLLEQIPCCCLLWLIKFIMPVS